MLGIQQICGGGKGEYEDDIELKDLEGRRSKATAELRQATNSGNSKRVSCNETRPRAVGPKRERHGAY
jgi:hypothetical protein